MEKHQEGKTTTVQMNHRRRNVEKARLLLYKRNNVRRNFEKIRLIRSLNKRTYDGETLRRLITYKRTNEPRTIDMTTVIPELGTYFDMEKRPDETNTVRTD